MTATHPAYRLEFLVMNLKYKRKNTRVLLPKGSLGTSWLRSFF